MREPHVYLEDILESIRLIRQYTSSLSVEGFKSSIEVQDAVFRRLEIIGEAVKSLPSNFKDKHPGIPWVKIGSLRDVLIHEYFGVQVERVWKILDKDIDELEKQIKALLPERFKI